MVAYWFLETLPSRKSTLLLICFCYEFMYYLYGAWRSRAGLVWRFFTTCLPLHHSLYSLEIFINFIALGLVSKFLSFKASVCKGARWLSPFLFVMLPKVSLHCLQDEESALSAEKTVPHSLGGDIFSAGNFPQFQYKNDSLRLAYCGCFAFLT